MIVLERVQEEFQMNSLPKMDFPAKIILFGEYGIILGSKALSLPYTRYSGYLAFPDNQDSQNEALKAKSGNSLRILNDYFKVHSDEFQFLNLIEFEKDIQKGLYFNSSIPSGSGLGSSGALTAAIYDKYSFFIDKSDIQNNKDNLAKIESCFHGQSSGIDPLTSWLNRPILFDNKCPAAPDTNLSQFLKTYTIYLINSGLTGNTGNLVSIFLEKYRDDSIKRLIDSEYIPLINKTIDSLISNDQPGFELYLEQYSKFQISSFSYLIPDYMIDHFIYGIKSGDFHLKICGSGGGGFILGITSDREKAESYFNLNQLEYSVV